MLLDKLEEKMKDTEVEGTIGSLFAGEKLDSNVLFYMHFFVLFLPYNYSCYLLIIFLLFLYFFCMIILIIIIILIFDPSFVFIFVFTLFF